MCAEWNVRIWACGEGRLPAEGPAAGPLRLPSCPHPGCDCNAGGTQNNACQKDPQLGRCLCKPNFQGIYCELCAPGFYGQDCHRESSPIPVPVPVPIPPDPDQVWPPSRSVPVFQPRSGGR